MTEDQFLNEKIQVKFQNVTIPNKQLVLTHIISELERIS